MINWTSWLDYGFMRNALLAILIITPSISAKFSKTAKAKTPSEGSEGVLFCVGIFLSSRAVASQVLWAEMSLTTVFGMGTGGPSS